VLRTVGEGLAVVAAGQAYQGSDGVQGECALLPGQLIGLGWPIRAEGRLGARLDGWTGTNAALRL
jgi:hypothetical protein